VRETLHIGAMIRRWTAAIFLMVGIVALSLTSNAIPSQAEKDNLHRVGALSIAVGSLPAWAEEGGITREDLKEHLMQALHKAGIEIVPSPSDKGAALNLTLSGAAVPIPTKEGSHNAYYFVADLSLIQHVRMLTDDRISLANTWSYEKAGISSSLETLVTRINGAIDGMVERFVGDYKSINP
jgi:hypothetical protein